VFSGSEIHVSLAPARDPFLPLEPERGAGSTGPPKTARAAWAPRGRAHPVGY
jgi:hypothetical protein